MAVLSLGCRTDKENALPPAARGIAVKSQAMKRPGGGSKAPPRRRPPLRDITCLFVVAPCPAPSAVPLALAGAALPEAARPGAGAPDGAARRLIKQGNYSLRKAFR